MKIGPDDIVQKNDISAVAGARGRQEAGQGWAGDFDDSQLRTGGAHSDTGSGLELCHEVRGVILEEGWCVFPPQDHRLQVLGHLLDEVVFHDRPMLCIGLSLSDQLDTRVLQSRKYVITEYLAEALLLGQGQGMDIAKEPGRIQPLLLSLLPAEPEKAPQGGDPYPKELIEVGRENGQEFDALEKRHRRALGLLENPFIKRQPAQLPIDVALGYRGHTEADFSRILSRGDHGADLAVSHAQRTRSVMVANSWSAASVRASSMVKTTPRGDAKSPPAII
jgi:hypothetical protein